MAFNFTWRAQSTIYRDSVDLVAIREIGGDLEVVQPVAFEVKRLERFGLIHEPTMELAPDSARSLMQALWDAGIRPAQWEGNEAQVSALKKHIDFAEYVGRTLLAKS